MPFPHFLLTQNRGYFLDSKSISVWLKKKDITLLKRKKNNGAGIFLYNRDERKVYGKFCIEDGISSKSKDGLFAVPIKKESSSRRGAFLDFPKANKDFSLYELDEGESSFIEEKLKIVSRNPAPVMLRLDYENGSFRYRYIELLKRVVILEDKLSVKKELLKEISDEYEKIMKGSLAEIKHDEKIRKLGNTLFNLLFSGDTIKTALCEGRNVIYLDIGSGCAEVPFEILNYKNEYLARKSLLSFGTQRNRLSSAVTPTKELNAAIVYIPEKSLTKAEEEVSRLYTLMTDYRSVNAEVVQHPLSYTDFHDILEKNDIVHIITHGKKWEGGSGWLIDDKRIVEGRELSSFSTPPSFIFAHTCETAFAPAHDTGYVVSALLQGGVKNVIAASGSLSDDYDEGFVEEFYRSLLYGESAANSFRNGLLRGRRNAFLRYRFFGSHNMRFSFKIRQD